MGPMKQEKIAISLAVVGALAAPFVFQTYKAQPITKVWTPFVRHRPRPVFHIAHSTERSGRRSRGYACTIKGKLPGYLRSAKLQR
jgi:hypothetical protein